MNFFHFFAKKASEIVGHAWAFSIALLIVMVWVISGPFFHFSTTWQLFINTGTTIITFLMVFLIQSTQNRDTETMQLKLDELIRSHRLARKTMIDLNKLSDEQLKELENKYNELSKR